MHLETCNTGTHSACAYSIVPPTQIYLPLYRQPFDHVTAEATSSSSSYFLPGVGPWPVHTHNRQDSPRLDKRLPLPFSSVRQNTETDHCIPSAPADNPLVLTPLRAHYLKRELVTLGFVEELGTLDSPSALSLLGPPFLPKSRFVDGVPKPAPAPGSAEALAEARGEEASVDLPFLRFVFHHFVLSFPFLANCPPTFFSHKLQPFVYSFVSRNISTSEDRDEVTKRHRIAGKIEKHLGLVMSAAIKVVENEGREEVVRIEEDGSMHTGLPASQESKFGNGTRSPPKSPKVAAFGVKGPGATDPKKEEEVFSINIVAVRNTVTKGRMRHKSHEEFIIRTRQKDKHDIFVARRYGDFTRLAETVSRRIRAWLDH